MIHWDYSYDEIYNRQNNIVWDDLLYEFEYDAMLDFFDNIIKKDKFKIEGVTKCSALTRQYETITQEVIESNYNLKDVPSLKEECSSIRITGISSFLGYRTIIELDKSDFEIKIYDTLIPGDDYGGNNGKSRIDKTRYEEIKKYIKYLKDVGFPNKDTLKKRKTVRAKEDDNFFIRKKVFIINVIQAIFIVVILSIALLEKNGIIVRKSSYKPFYAISIILYLFVIIIVTVFYMNKDSWKKNASKLYGINLIFFTVQLILLFILCFSIDSKIDKMEFIKHCSKTKGYIDKVNKDAWYSYSEEIETKKNKIYYVCYKYSFSYEAEGRKYNSEFTEAEYIRSEIFLSDEELFEKWKPRYHIDDIIEIYYDTNNPISWKWTIVYVSERTLLILEIIILIIEIFSFGKAFIEYKKVTPKGTEKFG